MKRITNILLTDKIKENIALYSQEFIEANFKNKVVTSSTHILQNNIEYYNKHHLAESILKQSLMKGNFPYHSFKKQLIMQEMKDVISNKVIIDKNEEKVDYKFIGEILTASHFAETSHAIKQVKMNSEHPNHITTTISKISGNQIRDITMIVDIKGERLIHECDIKAGNNAMKPFSNVVAIAPYTEEGVPYTIINNNPIDLEKIQESRLNTFKELAKQTSNNKVHEFVEKLEVINCMPLDIFRRNLLIQEEILAALSQKLITNRPSFFISYVVPTTSSTVTCNQEFYRQLEPYITLNVFSSKKDFKIFMSAALKAYNNTVAEIAQNVKGTKDLFREAGFSDIANDIFN